MKYSYIYISFIITVYCLLLTANSTAQIITTVAGAGSPGFSGDGGQATNAELSAQSDVILDSVGNLYIADLGNNRIRKVNTNGVITTIAGTGTAGYSGDGGQATAAELYAPTGLCFDTAGNLYIAEYGNSRIRMINTNEIISTVAGDGAFGFSGDGGQATNAECNSPEGVAFDTHGNLYIADLYNNRIRIINTLGVINTIAGSGTVGYSGDGGQATNAELDQPKGITFDMEGNLYIADASNSCIRKVNSLGIISTIVGNGTQGYSGDGGEATNAELNDPTGVTFDTAGNLYFSDSENNRIRMVNTAGIISTIAGNGTQGYSGDGGLANAAELNGPCRVTFDNTGNLYFSENGNNHIRKVSNVGQTGINQVTGIHNQVTVYPNPVSNSLQVSFSGNIQNTSSEIYNMIGECVHRQIATSPFPPSKGETFTINVADLSDGVYLVRMETTEGMVIKKIIKQ